MVDEVDNSFALWGRGGEEGSFGDMEGQVVVGVADGEFFIDLLTGHPEMQEAFLFEILAVLKDLLLTQVNGDFLGLRLHDAFLVAQQLLDLTEGPAELNAVPIHDGLHYQ